MKKLSKEQRRVLKMIGRHSRSAKEMRTGVRTLMALSARKLIYVPCTIDNIAFPRNAIAEITRAGISELCRLDERLSAPS